MISSIKSENLSFLFNQPASVIQDFSRLIIDYLSKGHNQKLYTNVAQKIEVNKETVQSGVDELVYLFVESYKKKCLEVCDTVATSFLFHLSILMVRFTSYQLLQLNIKVEVIIHQNKEDESTPAKLTISNFQNNAITVGFNEEQAEVLSNFYSQQETVFLEILQLLKNNQLPHFVDLEWRFETKIASRALLNQCDPLITMKLKIDDLNSTKNVILQTDPAALSKITNKLKDALKEASSAQSKRVCRKFS